jgi:hypothetical protein
MAKAIKEQDSTDAAVTYNPGFSNYFLTQFKFSSHYRMLEFIEDVS